MFVSKAEGAFVKGTDYRMVCSFLMLALVVSGCGGNGSNGNDSSNNNSDNGVVSVGSVTQSIAQLDTTDAIANVFENPDINEVSGLQRSLIKEGVYYVHNDSGDDPTIHVTDAVGKAFGTINVAGVEAIDWEGIAATRREGLSRLVIGDIGNNGRLRSDLRLIVLDEPDVSDMELGFSINVPGREIQVSYSDGVSYDAEALYIHSENDTVVVLTKSGLATTEQGVWRGSLSSGLDNGSLVLEYFGLVSLTDADVTNAITDVDIHHSGREVAVLTYGPSLTGLVHLWVAEPGEGTTAALLRSANRTIEVPRIGSNGQAEAISYDPTGGYLLVGSESGSRSMLTIVPYEGVLTIAIQ